MTVLAMRSSDVQHDRLVEEEMDEAVGWPFSSAREVVITRQHDSTSGQKSKMDYLQLYKSMWKKFPEDVKLSGNSWKLVQLLMERPTLTFDCLPEFVNFDIYLLMSEQAPELAKETQGKFLTENNLIGVLNEVSDKYDALAEFYDYNVKHPKLHKKGLSTSDAVLKVIKMGKKLRKKIQEKKRNLVLTMGGSWKWTEAKRFYRGVQLEVAVSAKPPLQYGKNPVKLKCVSDGQKRLLGYEESGADGAPRFYPFTAQELALIILDAAA